LPQLQAAPQSGAQVWGVSPQAASHVPSPHSQFCGQSWGQLKPSSKHCG
jgi:hypothetical protein